ncbi:MAG: VOC family protein [Planctomycetota bacterium]
MSAPAIVPCLWFDDRAEAAASFYVETVRAGRVTATTRYPSAIDNPSNKPRGSVLAVEFELAGARFLAVNGGPLFTINPSISFFLHTDSVAETERLFDALATGGKAMMPLGTYPWSERYGWVQDRFGVSWQVMKRPPGAAGATIVPCLLFVGARFGQAAAALQAYAGIFPGGHVERLEHYARGEGPTDMVKHGRVTLAGQALIASDGPGEHAFSFNEAVSLQVQCDEQAEIDRYWAALAAGGEPGPCGWLKDRFGVSWQVAPRGLGTWLGSDDEAARDRTFAAMLAMGKLDVAALQAAFAGR